MNHGRLGAILPLLVMGDLSFMHNAAGQCCEAEADVAFSSISSTDYSLGMDIAVEGDFYAVAIGEPATLLGGGIDYYERVKGTWVQLSDDARPDGLNESHNLGKAIAISLVDQTVLIVCGARGVGPSGSVIGVAHVATPLADGFGGLSFIEQLEPDGPQLNDGFGHDVDISGETIVCGAPARNGAQPGSGAAIVFQREPSGQWSQEAELIAPDGQTNDDFGSRVAIHNDVIAVGAPSHGAFRGAVYVFERSGGTWGAPVVLESLDPNALLFGTDVAVSENRIAVGEWTGQGQVVIYERVGNEWMLNPASPIMPCDAVVGFGRKVDLFVDQLLVGHSDPGSNAGGYLFERNSGTWQLVKKLVSPAASGGIGSSVSLCDGVALCGSPDIGEVAVFDDLAREDVNADGHVGVGDLIAVILAWGTADSCADVDLSGSVAVSDLVAVIKNASISNGTD